ncbi:MAG: S8 family peptidase [Candidatus Bruticola sp.]
MEIRPTMSAPTSQIYTGAKSAPTQAPVEKQPEETFIASSNNGPVNLIITNSDKAKLEEMRASILAQNPENKVTADLPLVNGFAVTVNPSADGTLLPNLAKANEEGNRVFMDAEIGIPRNELADLENTFRPLMDTANVTLGVDKLHDQGITGKGVTVCVIDTGIAQHPDFEGRIVGFKDMVNGRTEPYDDQGHGTHCTGICAGSGKTSEGKYTGVAPEANIVGVKVLDRNGSGSLSNVIKGVQWAVENKDELNIDVISMSLGGYVSQSYKDDPVVQAVEAAHAAGISCVVAAGNEGPSSGTIGSPGNAPHAITVGALDDRGTVDRSDDQLAYFSSRGPSRIDKLEKPDILAPGVNITATSHKGKGYVSMSGTSMATPFAAGVDVLMHQVKPNISPDQVKEIMMKNADALEGVSKFEQGKGVIDPQENIEFLMGK